MDCIDWPTELPGRFLHFLALSGAERTFQQLSHLTCKNADIQKLSPKIERPLVLRTAFDGQMKLPLCQSTVADIEIP
jgi:hypothetical protein